MTTEFAEKLEEIISKHDRWIHGASERALNILDTYDAIKQLFLDTVLKAIGNETKVSYSREDPIPFWRNIGRNKLRKELKAKILRELGIK